MDFKLIFISQQYKPWIGAFGTQYNTGSTILLGYALWNSLKELENSQEKSHFTARFWEGTLNHPTTHPTTVVVLDRKNISDDRGGWGCGWWGREAEGWPHTLGTIFQIPTVLEIQQNLGGDWNFSSFALSLSRRVGLDTRTFKPR